MSPTTRVAAVLTVPLVWCVVACGSMREEGAAAVESRSASLEESCGADESFSAREVLEALHPEYGAPLYYPERRAMTQLRLRPTYRGGDVECRPADSGPSKLVVDVSLHVESGDGAFETSIPSKLSGFSDSREFMVRGAVPLAELSGSFAERSEADADADLVVEGWLETRRAHSEGAIRVVAPKGDTRTAGVWDRGRHVISRNHRPCAERPGLTPAALRDALDGLRPGRLQTEGRDRAVAVRLRQSSGEHSYHCRPGGAAESPALETEVQLEIRHPSADERWDIPAIARMGAEGRLSVEATVPVSHLPDSLRGDSPDAADARIELEFRDRSIRAGAITVESKADPDRDERSSIATFRPPERVPDQPHRTK